MEIMMNSPLDPVNPPPNLMDLMLDDAWLNHAIEGEEADDDSAAGLGYSPQLGKMLRGYLASKSIALNQDRLVRFLQEELGEKLSNEDLEMIASELQLRVQERLQQRQSA
jgi:hypothetical protein